LDICNNISRDPCCTDSVVNKIKSLWQSQISKEEGKSMLSVHDRNLQIFMYYKFKNIKMFSQFMEQTEKNITPKNRVMLGYLSNDIFSVSSLTRIKASGRKCWNYLSNLIKGTYCMACDLSENHLRFGDKGKWNISLKDIQEQSINCSHHNRNIAVLIEYLVKVQDLLHLKYKEEITIVHPKWSVESVEEYILANKRSYYCSKDVTWCDSELLLKQFYIAPMLKLEMVNQDFFDHMSTLLIKYFSSYRVSKYENDIYDAFKKEDVKLYTKVLETQKTVKDFLISNPYR